jgi:hypothetical protein
MCRVTPLLLCRELRVEWSGTWIHQILSDSRGGGGESWWRRLKAVWVMRGGDDGLIGVRVEAARSMLGFGLSGWWRRQGDTGYRSDRGVASDDAMRAPPRLWAVGGRRAGLKRQSQREDGGRRKDSSVVRPEATEVGRHDMRRMKPTGRALALSTPNLITSGSSWCKKESLSS